MCFDKTGTLTEEGLDLYGIRSIVRTRGEPRFGEIMMQFAVLPEDFEEIMASCHGLTVVQGKVLGEELELKMFDATGWKLVEEDKTIVHKNSKRLTIQKRFEFSSTLQRMSVIVEDTNGRYSCFVKGSPEKLRELCIPSTLPKNFHRILDYYAKSGFRVLACASRKIDRIYLERNDVEHSLVFEGLLIMQNKLKE
jgi:cation-transporting ATPase 13A3/4/5